jgi:hypothetical protein
MTKLRQFVGEFDSSQGKVQWENSDSLQTSVIPSGHHLIILTATFFPASSATELNGIARCGPTEISGPWTLAYIEHREEFVGDPGRRIVTMQELFYLSEDSPFMVQGEIDSGGEFTARLALMEVNPVMGPSYYYIAG